MIKKLVVLLLLNMAAISFAQNVTLNAADIKPQAATQAPTPLITQGPVLTPTPPTLDVKAYVLMDAASGAVIAQKNGDAIRPPASLTKMMTLYITSRALASGQIHMTDKVHVSKNAWKGAQGGSKMFLKPGEYVLVKDLIQGIIVDSGNDACIALAEYIGGSETTFTQMMNQQAAALGMKNTHYTDSTGLPHPNHYSTAYDLAILAHHLITDFPDYYGWYKQKWFKYNGIRQPNRNRLLWRFAPYADGIKTGHTDQAGYCLVGSAQKEGLRLISVVLGAPSDEMRSNTSQTLLQYGFRFFESHLVYQANSPIIQPRVWFGDKKRVKAGTAHDFYLIVPKNQFNQVKVTLNINPDLQAPISQGQKIGVITALLNNKIIATQDIVALENVQEGGIIRKLIDYISHFFAHWFTPKAKQ